MERLQFLMGINNSKKGGKTTKKAGLRIMEKKMSGFAWFTYTSKVFYK
jgi:hypothetical protein